MNRQGETRSTFKHLLDEDVVNILKEFCNNHVIDTQMNIDERWQELKKKYPLLK